MRTNHKIGPLCTWLITYPENLLTICYVQKSSLTTSNWFWRPVLAFSKSLDPDTVHNMRDLIFVPHSLTLRFCIGKDCWWKQLAFLQLWKEQGMGELMLVIMFSLSDIDECQIGVGHNCSIDNEVCVDKSPGFICQCAPGYRATAGRNCQSKICVLSHLLH